MSFDKLWLFGIMLVLSDHSKIYAMQKGKEKVKPVRVARGSKADHLSMKEAGFVKDFVLTGNGTQSALKNYDTTDYSTAGMIACDNLKKPKIQKAILSIAERIPDSLLLQTHLEGLKAFKKSGVGGMAIGMNKDGGVEGVGHVDTIEPDFAVRHKYLDTAYKLKNVYPKEGNVTAIQVNVNTDRQDFNAVP